MLNRPFFLAEGILGELALSDLVELSCGCEVLSLTWELAAGWAKSFEAAAGWAESVEAGAGLEDASLSAGFAGTVVPEFRLESLTCSTAMALPPVTVTGALAT